MKPTTKTTRKPELLAPAGSTDAFYAALQSGADAVYCGLPDFNARIRAKNFTIKSLAHLVPYAHSCGKRVYVTLNTLIKQSEFESVIHLLYQLEQIKIDAIIVTDQGLITIAHTYFPSLILHGSTQMTIHNTSGVRIAHNIGLKRVVLARELTMEEIKLVSNNAPIELEVFIHGALCYSISGLCLSSSFIGGASGNRGRCTQVCRRKFQSAKNSGYYFSPDDFSAVDYISQYIEASISSLKIEGRMKNADYVATVVSTYRKLLDNTITVEEARDKLDKDWGRPKTSFFLGGTHTRGHINASRPSGTGQFLSTIIDTDNEQISFNCAFDLSPGDRLRIHPQNGFEGITAVVKSIVRSDSLLHITLKNRVECAPGDTVYRIGTRQSGNSYRQIHDSPPVHINQFYQKSRTIISACSRDLPDSNREKSKLWCKIDNIDWLVPLTASPCRFLLCAADYSDLLTIISNSVLLKTWRSRLIPCLPPFISEQQIPRWNTLISEFKKEGITRWVCSNIGHRALFGKGFSLIADYSIPVLNSVSCIALEKLGFSMFIYSPEDDYCNLKSFVTTSGILHLHAHVPLLISRIRPAVALNTIIRDPHGNEFFTYCINDLYYTSSPKNLCLIGKKSKLEQIGITNFLIDLSQIKPDQLTLNEIITHYKSGVKIPGTSLFNFKSGLK